MVMVKGHSNPVAKKETTGVERLTLRVSSMIAHPVAQARRWVKIHRLDTDGDREWEEVTRELSETDQLNMTFGEDGSVTLRWELIDNEGLPEEADGLGKEVEIVPF